MRQEPSVLGPLGNNEPEWRRDYVMGVFGVSELTSR